MSHCLSMGAPMSVRSPKIKTPCRVAFINDDQEELRQRRLDSHMRSIRSPGTGPLGFGGSRVEYGVVSNAQIAEHYADCIKLSSENKINARNAFGLHLIDYMLEVLLQRGELENFQVAGCTLDAGAKIYASRVDSLYSEAYKILGGMGTSEVEKEQHSAPTSYKEKPTKDTGSVTIEKNLKALSVSQRGSEMEESVSFVFDEGREEGLLQWQLVTREDCSLVLDPSCSCDDVEPSYLDAATSGDALRDILLDLSNCMDSLEVCRSFLDFEMREGECVKVSFNGDTPLVHHGFETPQPDYSMVPCPASDQDSYCGTDYCSDGSPEPLKVEHVGNPSVFDSSCNHFVSAKLDLHPASLQTQSVHHKEVVLTSTLAQSEYSYFDPEALSAWAGIQHWKLKPVRKKGKPSALGTKKSTMRIDFRSSVGDHPFDECQSAAMVLPGVDRAPLCTDLPLDIHLNPNALHELFLQTGWKVEKKQLLSVVEEETGSFQHYDEVCGVEVPESPSVDMTVMESTKGIYNESQDISHYELLSEPRKVDVIQIDYSRKSKRIDAKKLKETMWKIINTDVHAQEEGAINFSGLCLQVTSLVSEHMKSDISIPICFVFLLHLANEKGLVLTDKDGICEVIIRSS